MHSGNLDYIVCNECGKNINTDHFWAYCSGHAAFKCISCGECFRYHDDVIYHIKKNRHPAFRCNVAGCTQTFVSLKERAAHHKLPHSTNEHGRVTMATPFDCAECLQSCNSKAELLRHSKECQHQPYRCECGQAFSRLDVLNRHIKSFDTSVPNFPCMFCRLHRGENGFRRADHLRQHERNYHRHQIETGTINQEETRPALKYVFPVCSHAGCPKYRNPEFHQLSHSIREANKPFAKLSEYTQHMRDEHNECLYPCDVAGCNRVGRRGYFREKDLMKHRKEQHPDADLYKVSDQVFMHTCTEPGCGKTLALSSVGTHYQYHARQALRLQRIDHPLKIFCNAS
ncbi:hypothetical protein B0O99DRAFT_736067 [Bisporella sp. PMI_857]|nr:hypothetical protein B0O99DRAFT_736067 [Bisporella sp. PMI_857]